MEPKRAKLLRFALIMGALLVSGLVFATLAEDIVNHETIFALDPVLGRHLDISENNIAGRPAIFVNHAVRKCDFYFVQYSIIRFMVREGEALE